MDAWEYLVSKSSIPSGSAWEHLISPCGNTSGIVIVNGIVSQIVPIAFVSVVVPDSIMGVVEIPKINVSIDTGDGAF